MTGVPDAHSPAADPAAAGSTATDPATTDAAARLRAVHERLTAAIADLTSAENWQLMLRTAAKLPTYSPHNVLLITSQFPQASAVAGFHTWKQLGRAVRKGEKGIAILAPVQRRTTCTEGALEHPAAADLTGMTPASAPARSTGDLAPVSEPTGPGTRRVVGFRVVHVFDISQTDGPDLPEPPQPVLLDGQAPGGLLDGLTRQVHEHGYQLLRHDFDLPHPGVGVPNGVTDYFARTVIVRPDLSHAQTCKTLAHELGHVLLHAPTVRPADLTRPQAEVEAESVAYVVAAAHGLDTSGYTIPYVAGWSEGNLELLARSAERVVATSHTILTHTPPPPTITLPDSVRGRVRDLPTAAAVPSRNPPRPDRTAADQARARTTNERVRQAGASHQGGRSAEQRSLW
jgi:DNA primase